MKNDVEVALSLEDQELFDAIFREVEGDTFFEREPSKNDRREVAEQWIGQVYNRVRSHICKPDIVAGTTTMTAEEAVLAIIDIVQPILETDQSVLATAVLVKLFAVYCVRKGLAVVCKGYDGNQGS